MMVNVATPSHLMKPTEFEASRKIQFYQLKGIFPCLENYEIDIQIDSLSEAEPCNLLKEKLKSLTEKSEYSVKLHLKKIFFE